MSSSYGDTETLQAIDNILSGAQADMANIASGFVATASSAQSQAEFDAMQSMALNEVEAAKKTAEVMLKDIRDSASLDEVFYAAQAALQELQTSKIVFRSIVTSIEYVDPVATTTTTTTTTPTTSPTTTTTPTTSPTTTSTTSTTTTTSATTSTTSTTTLPPSFATTTVPTASTTTTTFPGTSSTTTTVPESSTTTMPAPSTSTTAAAAIVAPDGGSGGGGGGFNMAMPPEDGMFGTTAAEPKPPSPVEDLSGWIASMLDVVLPPVVVSVVLSPLIIIEVIGRTIFRSGSAILLPILLLGLSILLLRWRDRSRGAAQTAADEGSQAAAA